MATRRKGNTLVELNKYRVVVTDLTGIDYGVTEAVFDVTAESAGDAEKYVVGFCKKSQLGCFDVRVRDRHSF